MLQKVRLSNGVRATRSPLPPRDDDALPFVGPRQDMNEYLGCWPRDFWCVQPSGDWNADTRLGAALARELIQYMREPDEIGIRQTTLGNVICEMLHKGPSHKGLAVGFSMTLAAAIKGYI